MLRLAQQAKQNVYRVMELRFYSYDKRVVTAAKKIKFAATMLGIQVAGPVTVPIRKKRLTVLRSPFKYKRFQDHFEFCTHITHITVATDLATAEDFLKYVKDTIYPGVALKVKKYCFEPLEKYYVSPYLRGIAPQLVPSTDQLLPYEKVWPMSRFPPTPSNTSNLMQLLKISKKTTASDSESAKETNEESVPVPEDPSFSSLLEEEEDKDEISEIEDKVEMSSSSIGSEDPLQQ